MSLPEIQTGLYQDHHPFLINRISKIDVSRSPEGKLVYDVYLGFKEEDVLFRKVESGHHIPNPWLRALRSGNNPSEEYLRTAATDYLSKMGPSEVLHMATPKHPMRWAGAGGMMIIRDNRGEGYVPLSVRPEYSFYGGRIDAQGGLSSRIIDWFAPQILGLREILEELIIFDEGKILMPVNFSLRSEASNKKLARRLGLDGLKDHHNKISKALLGNVSDAVFKEGSIADKTPEDFSDNVRLHDRDKVFASSGLVIVDPSTASLDLRHIYEVPVSDIKNLLVLDGEVETDYPDKSQDRKILLFKLNDLLRLKAGRRGIFVPVNTFQAGVEVPSEAMTLAIDDNGRKDEIQLTPVLAKMLEVCPQ